MSRKKSTIGVAAIAKNEVDRIDRLLKHVDFSNEVVVVDSESTDGTQDLYQRMGVKIVYNENTLVNSDYV